MAKHLTKENIKSYTSNFHYNYFERGDNGCEELDFYTNIKQELNVRYQFYNVPHISEKIVGALCYIYNRRKNLPAGFKEDLCWYLYYWLGDKIYPLVHDKNKFSYIIKMIYGELYRSIADHFIVCNHVYSSINRDSFKNNKVLFDYSKDYQNIQIDTPHAKTTCDNDYKEYLEKYINMYNEAYSDCYNGERKNFDCDYFSKLFKQEEFRTLSSFNCIQSDNGRVFSDVQREPEDQPSALAQHVPQPIARASFRHLSATRGSSLSTNLTSDSPENTGTIQPVPIEDTAEGGSSKTIASSIVPVLGVSSFSLLLYKVTPVGGFINRLLGRNRNMYNNIVQMDEFNPYNDGMDPGSTRMNISYHRM
ncbi:PIR protein [Plasmodium vivax]|uniref:VIR protein n=1 Tax=Plasmodium vivax TaxID=5855 RepID=A0A565A4T2_PLAVI|nr:PIR protein [Plasmodium vivax]